MARASIDQIVGGIYRISLWSPPTGITFNQFLIDDEAPTPVPREPDPAPIRGRPGPLFGEAAA